MTRKRIGLGVLASTVALSLCVASTPGSAAQYCGEFWEHENYRGRGLYVRAEKVEDLNQYGMNDMITSLKVYAGCTCKVYWDPHLEGRSMEFAAVNFDFPVPNIGPGANDQISSIECWMR